MPAIDHRQVQDLHRVLAKHEVTYLFIGKTGAIIHGFPDTTQDADLFVPKNQTNARALTRALRELGFEIATDQAAEIERGKDFIQLKNGPFDVDLVYAPDGIDSFEKAWRNASEISGLPVCSIDDIIASKQASGRQKDRETLPRLKDFRRYLDQKHRLQPKRLPPLSSDRRAATRPTRS